MSLIRNKGPKYTTSSVRNIAGEDHLGIRSVGISIADHLQSGVTSITPRARYWAFFAWVLHDFIQNVSEEKTVKNFKRYLKRQEWFFILANIAEAEERGVTTSGVIGSTKGNDVWKKPQDSFEPFYEYVKDSFGGYGTYRNVMKIVGVTMVGDEAQGVQIDRVTKPSGIQLAEAFEQSIKGTEYYQKYRLTNNRVPRSVLMEYGQVASLDRLKDTNSKDYKLLRELFMPNETKQPRHELRKQSFLYYMTIIKQSNDRKLSFSYFQEIMYDGYYHKQVIVPKELQGVAVGWEIYQARQFFTFSLDSIWSYLLDRMSRKVVTTAELITTVLTELENRGYDLSLPVTELISQIPLPQEVRKDTIEKMGMDQKDSKYHIYKPIIVMLEVGYRLQNRNDFEMIHNKLLELGGRDSISFKVWDLFVESYKDKTIRDFISYILRYFILEQHQKVALNKIITTKNETYHFIENDGKLHFIKDDRPVFNTFRVNQGLSILEDLGLIKEHKGKYEVTSLGQVMLNGTN